MGFSLVFHKRPGGTVYNPAPGEQQGQTNMRNLKTPLLAFIIGGALTSSGAALGSREGASLEPRVDEIFKEFTAPGSPGCTAGVYRG